MKSIGFTLGTGIKERRIGERGGRRKRMRKGGEGEREEKKSGIYLP